jgi:uncharacterized membrane protein
MTDLQEFESPSLLRSNKTNGGVDFMAGLHRLENWFLIIALIYGIAFAFLVPPNQVPDEAVHFARAYAILSGNFTSSEVRLPLRLRSLMSDDFRMPAFETKFDFHSYLTGFSSSTDYSETVEFRPAASYSPVLYLPQLLGILVAKALRMNAPGLFILGRIFSILLYATTGYFVLKSSPAATKGLFVFLTMPMNLYMAASYSADTVQLCLTLFYLGLVVLNLDSSVPLNRKVWGNFLLAIALLSFGKPISLVLPLLCLAIPTIRFGSLPKKMVFVSIQLGLGLLLAVAWNRLIASNLILPDPTISPVRQIAFVLYNPLVFMKALLSSWIEYGTFYFQSFVGFFGWLTAPLPYFVYLLFVIVLGLAIWRDRTNPLILTKSQRLVFLLVFFLYSIGFFLIMYLFWNPIGNHIIFGVQGRYFIPVFPLVLYLITSVQGRKTRSIKWPETPIIVCLATMILSFAIFSVYLNFFDICGEQFFSISGTCKLPHSLPVEKAIGELIHPVSQTFTVECDTMQGVEVLFATYERRNRGTVMVSLQDETTGKLVVEETIRAREIQNNKWLSFRFSAIPNIRGHNFVLTLTPKGSSPGNAVTIWATESDLYLQGKPTGVEGDGDLLFRYVCPYGLVKGIR